MFDQKPREFDFSAATYSSYYFDGVSGNDDNDGKSENSPFKSVEKLNEILALKEPLKVFLRRGSVFRGKVVVGGMASHKGIPLIVSSYGDGALPVIDGDGEDCAVEISRGYAIFSETEVTNPKGLIGIFVKVKEAGSLEYLVIRNCVVRDVNFNWIYDKSEKEIDIRDIDPERVCPQKRFYYETGGIIFLASDEAGKPCNYRDVKITDNFVTRVSRSGIFLTGLWIRRPGTCWGVNPYFSDDNGWYPSERIEISRNKVTYTGGDGIVLIGSVHSLIERNVSCHSNYLGRTGNANAGIWPIGCKDIAIRYNEAAYSHLEHGGLDGEGFDIDIANEDVLFEYNYAHDNDGGAILLCNAETTQPLFDENGKPVVDKNGKQKEYRAQGVWRRVTIRNCVAVNNGKTPENPNFIHFSSTCRELTVENNTVIMREDLDNQMIVRTADYANCGRQDDLTFRGNLFYAPVEKNCSFFMDFCDRFEFDGNYYKNTGSDCAATANEEYPELFSGRIFLPSSLDGFENAEKIAAQTNGITVIK